METLPRGCILYSRFKIPIQLQNNSVCSKNIRSSLSELLQVVDLVIWDEAPVMHRNAFEVIDLLKFKTLITSCRPFGEKMMLLGGGDFR